MHPNIFQIVGCLTDNIIPIIIIIMIPIVFKEGPTCLKDDIFQITSLILLKYWLLKISHLCYIWALDTQILEKFKLNKVASMSMGFTL